MLVGVFSEHSVLSVSPSCPLAAPVMRPDSLPRHWRYTNLLLTYLLTYKRPLNKGQGRSRSFCYQSIPHTRLTTGCQ